MMDSSVAALSISLVICVRLDVSTLVALFNIFVSHYFKIHGKSPKGGVDQEAGANCSKYNLLLLKAVDDTLSQQTCW